MTTLRKSKRLRNKHEDDTSDEETQLHQPDAQNNNELDYAQYLMDNLLIEVDFGGDGNKLYNNYDGINIGIESFQHIADAKFSASVGIIIDEVINNDDTKRTMKQFGTLSLTYIINIIMSTESLTSSTKTTINPNIIQSDIINNIRDAFNYIKQNYDAFRHLELIYDIYFGDASISHFLDFLKDNREFNQHYRLISSIVDEANVTQLTELCLLPIGELAELQQVKTINNEELDERLKTKRLENIIIILRRVIEDYLNDLTLFSNDQDVVDREKLVIATIKHNKWLKRDLKQILCNNGKSKQGTVKQLIGRIIDDPTIELNINVSAPNESREANENNDVDNIENLSNSPNTEQKGNEYQERLQIEADKKTLRSDLALNIATLEQEISDLRELLNDIIDLLNDENNSQSSKLTEALDSMNILIRKIKTGNEKAPRRARGEYAGRAEWIPGRKERLQQSNNEIGRLINKAFCLQEQTDSIIAVLAANKDSLGVTAKSKPYCWFSKMCMRLGADKCQNIANLFNGMCDNFIDNRLEYMCSLTETQLKDTLQKLLDVAQRENCKPVIIKAKELKLGYLIRDIMSLDENIQFTVNENIENDTENEIEDITDNENVEIVENGNSRNSMSRAKSRSRSRSRSRRRSKRNIHKNTRKYRVGDRRRNYNK